MSTLRVTQLKSRNGSDKRQLDTLRSCLRKAYCNGASDALRSPSNDGHFIFQAKT